MEEKIYELLTILHNDIKDLKVGQTNLETRFDGLETRFDGLETRFDGLETRFDGLETRFDGLETRFNGLEMKVDSIDKAVIRIENDNHIQHTALFDGWKQNTQQLERIEKEVTKQDEIIMRRIK